MHSSIVGGSNAARIIACPGSYALSLKSPPKQSSDAADRGTLLHTVIANVLERNNKPDDFIGMTEGAHTLTQDLIDEKITPALAALKKYPETKWLVEQRVDFGDTIPGAFGTADMLGRRGDTVIVLDWKFGDGEMVSAEDNKQLFFYAAAAKHSLPSIFNRAKKIEFVIVQPPHVSEWDTNPRALVQFESKLIDAVKQAQQPNAKTEMGPHCRFCPAKTICPERTGVVDRAIAAQLTTIPVEQIGYYLDKVDILKDFISEIEKSALTLAEKHVKIPGYKLVAKRGRRQWANEKDVIGLLGENAYTKTLITPPQAEKLMPIPKDMIISVSSGSTLVRDDDPRPELVNLGQLLTNAFKRIL